LIVRALLILTLLATNTLAQTFDTVLHGGRVMDPESGLDAVHGAREIDVHGLVVAPGFIDLHSHGQDPENYAYKARDGVTTALEMEVGVYPVNTWYAAREGKSLVNFGATSGHIPARMLVMHDTGTWLPRDKAQQKATAAEIDQTLSLVRKGIDDGGLGVGLGIAYMPHATRPELLQMFQLAASKHTGVFVHMRDAGPVEPGVVDALQEVLADAAVSGAPLHIVHITSMGMRQTGLLLSMIAGARKQGLDVTTEAYPYTAGSTSLDSAVFNDGWQERLGISYDAIQWVATGERLNAETFARYRKQGGIVVIHSIPEDVVRTALQNPLVMIASDGFINNGKGHPRSAGCYARVLGYYVREQKVLPLMEALKRMTLMPAQRLEAVTPQMRNKGRVKVGADADLTVFDPATVKDVATFEQPAQYSTGIPYVFVNGVIVVNDSKIVSGVMPGKGVKR
jgi:N-acyl-D-aspartate/D-glutamate deacylase